MSLIAEKRYFVLYRGGKCVAKMACNLVAMLERWEKEPGVKEVTKEEYEAIETETAKAGRSGRQ